MNDIRRPATRCAVLLVAGLLFLIAASRIIHLYGLEMHTDEVWSIWQSLGPPDQIIRWTPYDWPPLYYLMLGGWQALVGIQPYTLRVSSLLLFLISVASLYRIARRLRDEPTAVMVILVYSALGFTIRISTEVRGYMLMITLVIAAFWLMLRYFEHPSVKRAIPLAVSMAAAFWTYFPSVIGFALIGLYSLVVYRRSLWRWWLPGLLALLLAAPIIVTKLPQAALRIVATDTDLPPTLGTALSLNFAELTVSDFVDYPVIIWLALFVAATLLVVWRWRAVQPTTWAFSIWIFVLPMILFALNPWLKFFDKHYSMALVIAIALWIGCGLAYMPRIGRTTLMLVFVALMFFPFTLDYYDDFWRPFSANFQWLSKRIQPGDVLLIDPNKGVDKYYEWAYASKLFFPNGLHFVTDPTGYRRVWYVTFENKRDPETDQRVRQDRLERYFVGPAYLFFRLYEAPPDSQGILFDNGMRFHGADILDESSEIYQSGPLVSRHENETVRLRLWWSVDKPPTNDYSVGLYLMSGMRVVSQVDGPPYVVTLEYPPDLPPQETSRWQPGRYYTEERELTVPDELNARRNAYQIFLSVYQWWDNERVNAPGLDAERLLLLQSIYNETW